MVDKMLLQALELASEGRRPEARRLLEEIVIKDPGSETAWLWLADCSDAVEERAAALEDCLRHNPGSQRAQAALTRLRLTAIAAERPLARIPVTAVSLNDDPRRAVDEPPSTPLDPFARQPGASVEGAQVFTVSPDQISPEEFAAIEARAVQSLRNRPEVRPLKAQIARRRARGEDWNELASTSGKRSPKKRRPSPPEDAAPPARRPDRTLLYTTAVALLTVLVVALALGALFLLRGV